MLKGLPRPCCSGSPPGAAESCPPPKPASQRYWAARYTGPVVAMAATHPAAALAGLLVGHSGMILGHGQLRSVYTCCCCPIKLPHHDVLLLSHPWRCRKLTASCWVLLGASLTLMGLDLISCPHSHHTHTLHLSSSLPELEKPRDPPLLNGWLR